MKSSSANNLLLMKTLRLFLVLSLLPIYSPLALKAQDEQTASAAWQVTKFDITVNAPTMTERVLPARAILTARNVGRGTGSTLSLRISPKAEVKSVTVNDAPATFISREETRQRTESSVASSLQRVAITLNAPAAPGTTLTVAV